MIHHHTTNNLRVSSTIIWLSWLLKTWVLIAEILFADALMSDTHDLTNNSWFVSSVRYGIRGMFPKDSSFVSDVYKNSEYIEIENLLSEINIGCAWYPTESYCISGSSPRRQAPWFARLLSRQIQLEYGYGLEEANIISVLLLDGQPSFPTITFIGVRIDLFDHMMRPKKNCIFNNWMSHEVSDPQYSVTTTPAGLKNFAPSTTMLKKLCISTGYIHLGHGVINNDNLRCACSGSCKYGGIRVNKV